MPLYNQIPKLFLLNAVLPASGALIRARRARACSSPPLPVVAFALLDTVESVKRSSSSGA
jgi:hypothetical protein